MTIKELLNKGYLELKENDFENPALEVRIILASILNCSKEKLMIKYNDQIDEQSKKEFLEDIEKILVGIPMQYITHTQEFMKLNFYVDENVLIPRADTEVLVEEVLNIANEKNDNNKNHLDILDMCTGSGAIIISLAKYLNNNNINFEALDISDKALEVAKKNSNLNDVSEKIKFIVSDMFLNLKEEEKFDIIVSNPPYIETDVCLELSKQVQNEPHIALDGGIDGLDFYRLIANDARKYLKENGYVCVEIGYNQKEQVIKIFEDNNYKEVYSKKDLYSNDRIVIAKI